MRNTSVMIGDLKYLRLIYCLLVFCVVPPAASQAQSLPVGAPALEDYYRDQQLLGRTDSSVSFMVRPLRGNAFPEMDIHFPDRLESDSSLIRIKPAYRSEDSLATFKLLPLRWQNQYNSSRPYGWNDGSMIPSAGFQTMFSAGVYLELAFLSIQLQPEIVYADNSDYDGLDIYGGAPDLPLLFGDESYSNANWGQSSVRLNYKALSVGISNENLWWGPGKYNSLLMSNTAEGFKHLTLNTVKPLQSPIGSFEFQLIAGKLENSEYNAVNSQPLYSDWRYLSALSASYQPKWIPGLFVGINRSFQTYKDNVSSFRDYFPLVAPFQKTKAVGPDSSFNDATDQLASVFARWVLPKAHAEIYFEYGANDHSYNTRDFIGSPEHSRAYIFGFSKLLPLRKSADRFIRFNAEVTQLSQSPDRLVRTAGSWYEHSQMVQGYTHRGQLLGAGIGPGGNLLTLDFAWINGLKSIGYRFDRYVHNDDYYEIHFDTPNSPGKWVDLSSSLYGTWNYKNLLLNAKLQFVSPLNYQWEREDLDNSGYLVSKGGGFNFQGAIGLTYRF